MTQFEPHRFGKYLLLEKVSSGGLAELYRAKMTGIEGFEKLVAVKLIPPDLCRDKRVVDMFIDESRFSALLQHQNIVQIYDFGSIENRCFVVTEYLFGKNLKAVWDKAKERNKPMGLESALLIVHRLCSALMYAHELKDVQGKPLHIVHGDISPTNILITYQGEIKIVDFGVAKIANLDEKTWHSGIKEKAAYMSPEQAGGMNTAQQNDLYSAGIILYELVTGVRMFPGDDITQILTRARDGAYNPPEAIAKNLPSKVYEVLHHALARDPSARYQNGNEFVADLEACISILPAKPTVRGLAQYMRDLFAEEISSEEERMRDMDSRVKETNEAGQKPPAEQPPEPVKRPPEEEAQIEPAPQKDVKPVPAEKPASVPMESSVMAPPVANTDVKEQESKTAKPEEKPVPPEIPEKTPVSPPKPPEQPPQIPAPNKKTVKPLTIYIILGIIVIAGGVLGYMFWIGPWSGQSYETIPFGDPGETNGQPEPPISSTQPSTPQTRTQTPKADQAPPGNGSDKIKALQTEAASAMKADPRKAASLLEEAAALDPANMDVLFHLGLAQVKLKEYPKAIATYGRVIATDPQFPDIYFNLGYAHAMNSEYSKAEQMYQKAVTLSPAYLDEALFNLAIVQEKQGKKAEALSNLQKAAATNPNNQAIKQHLERMQKTTRKSR